MRADTVVWAFGYPETAVATTGWLARECAKFRLGWSLRPFALRQVCAASPVDQEPVALAKWWEEALLSQRRAHPHRPRR